MNHYIRKLELKKRTYEQFEKIQFDLEAEKERVRDLNHEDQRR